MNRTILAVGLIASIVASMATLAWTTMLTPDVVQAAPEPPAQALSMRVAVVNLEEVSRNTPLFKQCKLQWDAAQADFKRHIDKLTNEYKETAKQLRRVELIEWDEGEDEILFLRVQLQAIEQTLKAADSEYKDYLAELLKGYQKLVLQEVMANVKRYVRQNGYHLVLQDYTTAEAAVGVFDTYGYAESLMSKPVLDAPGAFDGSNVFVKDITAELVTAMRKGGVPEDPDEG